MVRSRSAAFSGGGRCCVHGSSTTIIVVVVPTRWRCLCYYRHPLRLSIVPCHRRPPRCRCWCWRCYTFYSSASTSTTPSAAAASAASSGSGLASAPPRGGGGGDSVIARTLLLSCSILLHGRHLPSSDTSSWSGAHCIVIARTMIVPVSCLIFYFFVV